MAPDGEAFDLLKALQRLRRRMAPPGSRRERLARRVYVPARGLLPARWRLRLRRGPAAVPDVARVENLGVRGPIRRIVLFKLDHIGDLIIGMRAMRSIREGFPQAHLTLVCASWNLGWAERLGWFNRIVPFDFFSPLNRHWSVTPQTLRALHDSVRRLPLEAYDLAIDLRHDADTRPCLYRVDARHRAGYHAPAEKGLPYLDLVLPATEGIVVGEGRSVSLHAELRLQVLACAVVAAFGEPQPHPVAALAGAGISDDERTFAVLAVGAGDPIRYWPIERYARVGRELSARHGLEIVVLAGVSEQAHAAALAAALHRDRVRTVIGRPLAELPQLVAEAALCVCNGSGMAHLAAGLGVPTVCILGGTTRMEVWHPAGPRVVSLGGRTPCQPCGLKEARDCPWDVACLTAVTAEHVLDACAELLGTRAPPALALPP